MAQLNGAAPTWMDLYTEGQYEKASQLLQEDFKTLKRQIPKKLLIGTNIGSIFFNQKKYTKARDILVPTFDLMQRQDHP
jgi:hypothetical protein